MKKCTNKIKHIRSNVFLQDYQGTIIDTCNGYVKGCTFRLLKVNLKERIKASVIMRSIGARGVLKKMMAANEYHCRLMI